MLSCLNCKKAVAPDQVKFFAEAFVCADCYLIAEQLYAKGQQELKMLLLLLKESIRVAIVKGELQFQPQQLRDMPKSDLLAHLAVLTEHAKTMTQTVEDKDG
jgi:hypothetical protein